MARMIAGLLPFLLVSMHCSAVSAIAFYDPDSDFFAKPEFTCDIDCAMDEICMHMPKACFTVPCPQYECVNANDSCDMECKEIWMPICGTDGVTYGNRCELDQAACLGKRVEADYDGSCIDCNVVADCAPVGCDDVWCVQCETDQYVYTLEGECCERCHDEPQDAVGLVSCDTCESGVFNDGCNTCKCSADGLAMCTYMACSSQDVPYCYPVEEPCPSICPMNFDPVCGSDGVTYGNKCQMGVADCQSNGMIYHDYDGPCELVEEPCPLICPMNVDPVCGSDGVTYGNECQMGVAECQSNGMIYHDYDGPCELVEVPCPSICPMNFDPVCGSDGVTYGNECQMRVAECQSNGMIYHDHYGPCEPCVNIKSDKWCLNKVDKCDSKDRVRNKCQLTCGVCEAPCANIKSDAWCLNKSDKCNTKATVRDNCQATCGICQI